MKYKSFNSAVVDNERRDCAVPGCYRVRYKISKLCRNHRQQAWRWGHPLGRGISKKDYAIEIDEVAEIVNNNLDHDGIQVGIKFFQRAMESSNNGNHLIPCHQYFARLHQANVKPIDLLILSAAIWLFAERNPRGVYSKEHEDHLLGNKIIRFVPYHGRTKGPEHGAVGDYIRKNIGVLLLNISRTIKNNEAAQRNSLKDQASPLNTF